MGLQYRKLTEYLNGISETHVELSYNDLSRILNGELPNHVN